MELKKSFENKLSVVRAGVAGAAIAAPMVVGTMTSFAADTGTSSDALTSACTSMASSITTAINGVIPIALPLVGASLVIVVGLKVFKRIVSKA